MFGITFAISPTLVTSPHFSPEQKREFSIGSGVYTTNAGLFSIAAVALGASPDPTISKAAVLISGVAAGFSGVISGGLALLALDPPDLNFTIIKQPETPTLSQLPLTIDTGLNQQSLDSFNVLSNNLLQVIGTQNALITSLNRADGALLANDLFWEQQQIQAAQEYTSILSQLYAQQPQLYANLANALKSNPGFEEITFNPSQFSSFQQSLRINGFSTSQLQLFSELGADITTIGQIMDNLLSIDSSSVASFGTRTFSDLLTDTSLASSSVQLSQTFQQGVIGGSSTSVPEPFTVIGTIIGGTAALNMRNKLKNK